MSALFHHIAPGTCCARLDIPARASDAGPQEPTETRDADDWAFEAYWQIRTYRRIVRDDPKVERKLKLEALDLAIDALKCAREMVEL